MKPVLNSGESDYLWASGRHCELMSRAVRAWEHCTPRFFLARTGTENKHSIHCSSAYVHNPTLRAFPTPQSLYPCLPKPSRLTQSPYLLYYASLGVKWHGSPTFDYVVSLHWPSNAPTLLLPNCSVVLVNRVSSHIDEETLVRLQPVHVNELLKHFIQW